MNGPTKLSRRQRWLYKYVKAENEKDPSRWIHLKEVVDAMNCDLAYGGDDGYEMNENPKSHNPCPALWSDVEAINQNPEVDEPIMYNNYNVKIPNSQEELDNYYTGILYRKARKILWRYGVAVRKAKKDGRMKMEFKPNGEMEERFVRALIRKACYEVLKNVDEEERGERENGANSQ